MGGCQLGEVAKASTVIAGAKEVTVRTPKDPGRSMGPAP